MDVAIFRWINGWPDSFAPLFVFLSEATKTLEGKVLLGLLAVAFLAAGNKTRKTLLLGLAAVGIANTITNVLKEAFPDPRPCVELAEVVVRTGKLTSAGTASAHSANMAALATMFVLVLGWKRGWWWIPVAVLTGLSRIYVGVHYPSQVLYGWTCGVFAAVLIWRVWEAWVDMRRQWHLTAVDEGRVKP